MNNNNHDLNALTHSFNHAIFILVDWSELDNEEQYRQRLREQQDSRDDQLIEWEDDKEREYRRRYIDHKYFVHTFSNITLYLHKYHIISTID